MTAEILVGIVFGPTVLGRFLPGLHRIIFPADIIQQNMLETVAWLGILFLLLETGLEIDFTSAWRQRGDALKIALAGIIIPLLIAFIPSLFIPDYFLADPGKRIIFAMFMATVMSITAMPVTARALHDLKLSKTDLGFLIMSALSVNDIIGWLIFTVVIGTFTQASFNLAGITVIFLLSICFAVLCLTLGRRFVNYVISQIHAKGLAEPASSFTFICLLGFFCGAITQKIGTHALFGFFIAGVVAGGAKTLPERTRQIISQMVYALFVPLFFVNIGLHIDFLANFNIFLVMFICAIGISVKFLGAWFGVNLTKVAKDNRLLVAIAHIPGGLIEIVVSVIALQYKLITEPVFVAIVFGAVLSSVLLGPWLSYAIKRRKKVSIFEYFYRRSIIANLMTSSRDTAIRKLCETVYEQEEISDVESIYSAVLQREQDMGTAVEEGLAVPHARLPKIKRPIIAFGRSISGIDWNSPDGLPTRFVFLILTPAGADVQVQILSLISRVFSNREVREAVLKARDSQQIWDIFQRALSVEGVIKR